jgi:hypothetical protein
MKNSLRFLALAFLVAMTGWWLAAGAHRGWTQTSVARKTLDEVPGLDFVGASVIGTVLIVGASCLVRRQPPQFPR